MAAAVGTAAITAFFVCVWFVIPIWYRLSGR
jgi:cbb3-type cytochrome oxidase subunit 3